MKADALIIETLERMLDEHSPASVVGDAEQGIWPESLWETLESAGLSLTWVPETYGGAGARLIDGFAVAKIAASFAAPVPLVETLLAGWTLSQAGLNVPAGPMTVVPVSGEPDIQFDSKRKLIGAAHRVPFGSSARHFVMVVTEQTGTTVALVDRNNVSITPAVGLSGESRDTIKLHGVEPISSAQADAELVQSLYRMGAAVRSQQIAGALQRILSQSTRYAGERTQFGRPIAKFQAVQHNLAALAGEMAAAGAAADCAARTLIEHGLGDEANASRGGFGQSTGGGKRPAPAPPSPIRFTARWASHASTIFITSLVV